MKSNNQKLEICPKCGKKSLMIQYYAPGSIEVCKKCGYTDYDYNFDFD